MRRKTSMILCVFTLLFISGCNKNSCPPVSSSEAQTALVETPEAIAIKYMKDKYDLDCEVVHSDFYAPQIMGNSYDKVLLRVLDDSANDNILLQNGQAYLDSVNDFTLYGHSFAVYINSTKGKSGEVIGDQYMWYTVYPLLDAWMNDILSQYAVCQPMCKYLFLGTNDWEFDYCFSPDFPIVTTKNELVECFTQMNLRVRAFYPESFNVTSTQEDWNSFQEKLCESYSFNFFGMQIREVPDSIYKILISDEMAFKRIGLSKYPTWTIALQNNNNSNKKDDS